MINKSRHLTKEGSFISNSTNTCFAREKREEGKIKILKYKKLVEYPQTTTHPMSGMLISSYRFYM